ncbi:MerR family transcriptional regulator [Jatrophihabitans sp. GAS493]|uniref:MerR family transcriptional regulator n=1 Tax=Jatrophihabitans sp. GAS493 TaxID=1907575 RepID=UPI000BB93CBE|nr:MerR family transcriptional regulator [Jatrophihabitans sp. GAS493]
MRTDTSAQLGSPDVPSGPSAVLGPGGGDVAAAIGGDDEFTIDELAARTGLTVRTVRYYASEGLLPPPVRRGRVAVYSTPHRMRLELVRELQDHGYTLAAIERVLSRIPMDASAADFAVQSALLTPWTPEPAEQLDRLDLERRAGRRLSEADVELLLAVGVVEQLADDTFDTTPTLLGIGIELLDLPIPAAVLRNASQVIDTHAIALADELSELFREGVWEPFRRGEMPRSDHEQLAVMLSRLRPLVVQGLVNSFGRASDRAARRSLHETP